MSSSRLNSGFFFLVFCLVGHGVAEENFTFIAQNIQESPYFRLSIDLPVTDLPFINSMEEAARRNPAFQFTAKYFPMGGWLILGVNSKESRYFTDKTYWEFFSGPTSLSVGVSHYFPKAGEQMMLNFTVSPNFNSAYWREWYANESI